MTYSFDMSKEQEFKATAFFPDGWRVFIIKGAEETTSKSGNEQIVWELEDEETSESFTLYTILTQGKRWLLKQLLGACQVPIKDGEIFEFESLDFFNNKRINCKIVNSEKDNTWFDREGIERKKMQKRSEIKQIQKPDIPF